ncbi:metalloregulator ArsR/SmtB family transcription factor [Aidingimonas lacisalsi]|uniref:metalloregulator ArsR/SmtB family transcription factor n=1 Tax=Aidingimonas lacisalsi TaxID=2604086 RepID=UPI0011D25C97|nr:metalloregulator ArsR/SmtB family transcription factor [Aidingimonas lacisalsi]
MTTTLHDSPASLTPGRLFKCLSDDTRQAIMLLVHTEGELCVCELTHALELSQPKVSRHLAQLRRCGLLQDRREGQWVYYRLMPGMPEWALDILASTARGADSVISSLQRRLAMMGQRPERRQICC